MNAEILKSELLSSLLPPDNPGNPPGGGGGNNGGNSLSGVQFNATLNGQVHASVGLGNHIYLGGSFTEIVAKDTLGLVFSPKAGVPAHSVKRLGIRNFIGTTYSSVVDAAGNVYLLGIYYRDGILSESIGLLKLKPDLTLDESFPVFKFDLPGSFSSGWNKHSLTLKNNKLYVTGVFSAVNSLSRQGSFSLDLANYQITPWEPKFQDGAEIAAETESTITYIKEASYHGTVTPGYQFVNPAQQKTPIYVGEATIITNKPQSHFYGLEKVGDDFSIKKFDSSFNFIASFTTVSVGQKDRYLLLNDYIVVLSGDSSNSANTVKQYHLKVYNAVNGNQLYQSNDFSITSTSSGLEPNIIIESNDGNSVFLATDFPMNVNAFSGTGAGLVRDNSVVEFKINNSVAEVSDFYPSDIVSQGGAPIEFLGMSYNDGILGINTRYAHGGQWWGSIYNYDLVSGGTYTYLTALPNFYCSNRGCDTFGDYMFGYWPLSGGQIRIYNRRTGINTQEHFSSQIDNYLAQQFHVFDGKVHIIAQDTIQQKRKLLIFDGVGGFQAFDFLYHGEKCHIKSPQGLCFYDPLYTAIKDYGLVSVNTVTDTEIEPANIYGPGVQAILANQLQVMGYARSSQYEAIVFVDSIADINHTGGLSYKQRLKVYRRSDNSLIYDKFVARNGSRYQMLIHQDILYMTGPSVIANPAVFDGSLSPHQCSSYPADCNIINNFVSINLMSQNIVQSFASPETNYTTSLNNNYGSYSLSKVKDHVLVASGNTAGFDNSLPEPVYYHVYTANTGELAGDFKDLYGDINPMSGGLLGSTKIVELPSDRVGFFIGSVLYDKKTVTSLIKVASDNQQVESIAIDAPVLQLHKVDEKLLVIHRGATSLAGHPVNSNVVLYDPVNNVVEDIVQNVEFNQILEDSLLNRVEIIQVQKKYLIWASNWMFSLTQSESGSFSLDTYAMIETNGGFFDFAVVEGEVFVVGSFDNLLIVNSQTGTSVPVSYPGQNFMKFNKNIFDSGVNSFSTIGGLTLEPILQSLPAAPTLKAASLVRMGDSLVIAGVSQVGSTPSSLAKYDISTSSIDTQFIHNIHINLGSIIPNIVTSLTKIDDQKVLVNGYISHFDSQVMSGKTPILDITSGAITDSDFSLPFGGSHLMKDPHSGAHIQKIPSMNGMSVDLIIHY